MEVALRFVYPLGGGNATSPQIELDLREFDQQGRRGAAQMITTMLRDLETNGRSCRFLKKMTATVLWELKPTSRGRQKGGARVYLAFGRGKEIVILNAEVKTAGVSSPSLTKFRQARQMLQAYTAGTLGYSSTLSPENMDPQ